MQLQIQQSMRNGKILMVSIQIMCENRHLTIGAELPVANATPSGSGTRGHGLSGLFFFSFSFFFQVSDAPHSCKGRNYGRPRETNGSDGLAG
jgi:hypothetical protein